MTTKFNVLYVFGYCVGDEKRFLIGEIENAIDSDIHEIKIKHTYFDRYIMARVNENGDSIYHEFGFFDFIQNLKNYSKSIQDLSCGVGLLQNRKNDFMQLDSRCDTDFTNLFLSAQKG